MLVQPRQFQLPEGYNPLEVPIQGTEKLVKRWPRWFAEFGITPEVVLHFVHVEHRRCSRPFEERRHDLISFGKKLDHNQRRRLWDELIKWQALLIKQLAARDQRNVYYRQSEKHRTIHYVKDGKLVRLDQHRSSIEAAWEPPCDSAEFTQDQ